MPVKGEEVNVDEAGGTEDGRWQPVDIARVIDEDIAVVGDLKEPIIAVPRRRQGHGMAGNGAGGVLDMHLREQFRSIGRGN